jgi:tetratricopeptide (TPR) repeat protein
MFEFGRDLRRRLSDGLKFTGEGLTRGDGALLELLDLTLLQAEGKAADVAAGRIGCKDVPSARLAAAGVWRELARRSGDVVALRKAAAHALAALEGFEIEGRASLAARARCEQAAAGLLGADLFGDDSLVAAATLSLHAAAAQGGVGAALAKAMLAGLDGRQAMTKGDALDMQAASAAFDAPLAALDAAGRRSPHVRMAGAEQRLVRVELLIGAAGRLKDRTLAIEALAQLKTTAQRLDPGYEPLLWGRAQGLKGAALSLLGELEADIGVIADGVDALADAVEAVAKDHSPLDWAHAQAQLGATLQVMGEASGNVRAFDQAVSCFDRANEVLKGQPAMALTALVASQRAAALARCAELTGDITVLDAAEAAYRSELASRRAVDNPVGWAVCQTNLARLYEARAELTGRDNGQRAAAAVALSAAFDVFAEHGLRSLSDMTLSALERVRSVEA